MNVFDIIIRETGEYNVYQIIRKSDGHCYFTIRTSKDVLWNEADVLEMIFSFFESKMKRNGGK